MVIDIKQGFNIFRVKLNNKCREFGIEDSPRTLVTLVMWGSQWKRWARYCILKQ